jgi:hypothetical protein
LLSGVEAVSIALQHHTTGVYGAAMSEPRLPDLVRSFERYLRAPASAKMQIHPAALPLHLIDLALAEILPAMMRLGALGGWSDLKSQRLGALKLICRPVAGGTQALTSWAT